jgi:hypothetical protein
MKVGMCGPRQCGKSLTARVFATQANMSYVNVDALLSHHVRYVSSDRLLMSRLAQLDQISTLLNRWDNAVFDLTPFNLLADVDTSIRLGSELDHELYDKFHERCREVAHEFDLIVGLLPFSEKPTPYDRHYTATLMGYSTMFGEIMLTSRT